MSIYDNETSKIYPDLNPTAAQEPQAYRKKKNDEIEVCERLAKNMKRFNAITSIVDIGLITSTLITGGVSITAFASGVALPVGIAISGTSLIFSLATAITQKVFKIFTAKQQKQH